MVSVTINDVMDRIKKLEAYLEEHPIDTSYEDENENYDDRCIFDFGNPNIMPHEQMLAYFYKDSLVTCYKKLEELQNNN